MEIQTKRGRIYSGRGQNVNKINFLFVIWSQRSSLVAHWLSVPEDCNSNPGGGEHFNLSFETHNQP